MQRSAPCPGLTPVLSKELLRQPQAAHARGLWRHAALGSADAAKGVLRPPVPTAIGVLQGRAPREADQTTVAQPVPRAGQRREQGPAEELSLLGPQGTPTLLTSSIATRPGTGPEM